MNWMIYGANGYTGQLIAREAVHRDMMPVLAGRSNEALANLAGQLGLEYRVFALDEDIEANLQDIELVLHCAGPFSATAEPMMRACINSKTHYLDITGEIAVFELAQRLNEQATTAGIVMCPGVGFDVVPTDCVAASLKQQLPDATTLALGFDSRLALSQGTAKTSIEGLAKGGCVRRDGKLQRVPLAYRVRKIDFGDGVKTAMTIPWGDVSTAYNTTGIGNIEVYLAASPGLTKRLKRLNLVSPLLGLSLVQRFLKGQVEKRVTGPGMEQRRKNSTYVWGEASNNRQTVTARMKTANGYDVTVAASLNIVAHLLQAGHQGGAITPAKLMGPDFAAGLPGSTPVVFG